MEFAALITRENFKRLLWDSNEVCPFSDKSLNAILRDYNHDYQGCGIKVITKKEIEKRYAEKPLVDYLRDIMDMHGPAFRQILRDRDPEFWTVNMTMQISEQQLIGTLMENYWDEVHRIVNLLPSVVCVNFTEDKQCEYDTVLIKH